MVSQIFNFAGCKTTSKVVLYQHFVAPGASFGALVWKSSEKAFAQNLITGYPSFEGQGFKSFLYFFIRITSSQNL